MAALANGIERVKPEPEVVEEAVEEAVEETIIEEAVEEAVEATAETSVKTYDVTGFQPFKVAIETDAEGKIVSVTFPEYNETPGLGAALIEDAAVFEALVGQSIAEAQIDARAGVTLTSNAINEALAMAAKEAE